MSLPGKRIRKVTIPAPQETPVPDWPDTFPSEDPMPEPEYVPQEEPEKVPA